MDIDMHVFPNADGVMVALIFLSLELFNLTRFGSHNPAPGNEALGDGLFQIPPQTGLAGLLFDRQFALLSQFPLLLLVAPGMLLAFKRRVTPRHLVLLGTVVAYLLAMSTFRAWWAGWSPPGRLPAVLTPLLACYVAVMLQQLHSWLANTLAGLAGMAGFLYSLAGDYKVSGNYGRWYLAFAAFVGLVWLVGRRRPATRIPAAPIGTLFPVLQLIRPRQPVTDPPEPLEPPKGRHTSQSM